MDDTFLKGVVIVAIIIAVFLLMYIKLIKERMKKYIFRSEKIERYFKE